MALQPSLHFLRGSLRRSQRFPSAFSKITDPALALVFFAAIAFALSPQAVFAQRGGSGGGHVTASAGGGHFSAGGSHVSSMHSGGSFHAAFSSASGGSSMKVYSGAASRGPAAYASRRYSSHVASSSGLFSSSAPGFSSARGPAGSLLSSIAGNAAEFRPAPAHVTIGFPPRSPSDSAALRPIPGRPGRGPVTFFGDGNEVWSEPSSSREPSSAREPIPSREPSAHAAPIHNSPLRASPQQRARMPVSAPVFHPAPFRLPAASPAPRPMTAPVYHAPAAAPPRHINFLPSAAPRYGPMEEAPPQHRHRFPRFFGGPYFGGLGFFGYPFGFYGFYDGAGNCDPFWIFPCNADFYSGYDWYASQSSDPVDLSLGLQEPSEEIYPGLWEIPPQQPGSSPAEIAAEKILTVLYLNDGSVYAVTDYWVADGKLHYNASYGGQNSIDLSQLDLQRTVDANAARGVPFTLKPAPPAQPAAPQSPSAPATPPSPPSSSPHSPLRM